MLKAEVRNGKVKTELDIFDFAKWGDKNDPNRINIFTSAVLLGGSFYLGINTRQPADKTKDVYVSFWCPEDSLAAFARKFDRFVREAIKENKATLSIAHKDRNDKNTSITFSAGINLDGKNDKKFSYFKIEIVNDTKTGSVSTGLATSIKPFGNDTGLAFAENLLAIAERMNTLFITRADGTLHEHMRLVAANKDSNNPAQAAAEASSETSYDEDYEAF